MKNAFKILMLVSIMMNHAFAGQEGGGGAGVVCKNTQGEITSVKLLDLYDAVLNRGHKISRTNEPVEQQITKALNKSKIQSFPHDYFSQDIKDIIKKMSIRYLPENIVQRQPYDLGDEPITIEDRCSIEWVAFYRDNSDTVQIVTKYFNKMGPTDQAALMIHEAIYQQRRKIHGDDTSSKTRKIVATLFASNISIYTVKDLIEDMMWLSHYRMNGATY